MRSPLASKAGAARRCALRRSPFQVVGQQILTEVPWRLRGRPRYTGALIGTDEHPAAFFAQIQLALKVCSVATFGSP
jgi:hypothetical protein